MSATKPMYAEEGAAWRLQLDGMLTVLRADDRPEAGDLAEHLARAQEVAARIEAEGPSLSAKPPARRGVSIAKVRPLAAIDT